VINLSCVESEKSEPMLCGLFRVKQTDDRCRTFGGYNLIVKEIVPKDPMVVEFQSIRGKQIGSLRRTNLNVAVS
jgi:hypothetical protein